MFEKAADASVVHSMEIEEHANSLAVEARIHAAKTRAYYYIDRNVFTGPVKGRNYCVKSDLSSIPGECWVELLSKNAAKQHNAS